MRAPSTERPVAGSVKDHFRVRGQMAGRCSSSAEVFGIEVLVQDAGVLCKGDATHDVGRALVDALPTPRSKRSAHWPSFSQGQAWYVVI